MVDQWKENHGRGHVDLTLILVMALVALVVAVAVNEIAYDLNL